MKSIGIGLVGAGVVGGGVCQHLAQNGELMCQRTGVKLELVRVAVRDATKARQVDTTLLTNDWRKVVSDPNVHIVAELMGGVTTAREVALATLQAGKSLVTANKALLAEHGEELARTADAHRVGIYFEASVAGGIPIIKALREGLRANRVQSIHGIVNGTCNYILTRMTEEGAEFATVLQQAKELGYAEADDSLDVDGHDAAHKAAVLASVTHGFWVRGEQVYVEGIRKIEALDIQMAQKFGYVIKLVAIVRYTAEGAVDVRVHPALVPRQHVLASVGGVYNAVSVVGDVVGHTLFYGRGAGASPTASAVLADLTEAALDVARGHQPLPLSSQNLFPKLLSMDAVISRSYLRLTVEDKPGVLAQVATILGVHGISISSVYQPEGVAEQSVPLVLLLNFAQENILQKAVHEIEQLAVVTQKAQLIRIGDL